VKHIILLGLFIFCKLINRRWWVKLDPEVTVLVRELNRLKWLKRDERPSAEEERMETLATQPRLGADMKQNTQISGESQIVPPGNNGIRRDEE
jgi:hypothetical protein